jgi:hypothetical protein
MGATLSTVNQRQAFFFPFSFRSRKGFGRKTKGQNQAQRGERGAKTCRHARGPRETLGQLDPHSPILSGVVWAAKPVQFVCATKRAAVRRRARGVRTAVPA